MKPIIIFDRNTKEKTEEKVYFKNSLKLLYSSNLLSRFLLTLISKIPFFSQIYGFINSLKISRSKIKPFIKKFNIDEKEFYKRSELFSSFNDFFTRRLKDNVREINFNDDVLVFPCDGRFLAYQSIDEFSTFSIKGQKFDLAEFLQNEELFQKYKNGSMLIARLAPQDYHRFHFPCDCKPSASQLINGYLYSVSPIAIRKNIKIFSENKRMLTLLETKNFGNILYIEIGATNVGVINQTFFPTSAYQKGEEKGYFSLGASSIVLLFEKDKIEFDQDLLDMTKENIETKSCFGQGFAKKK